MISPKIKKLNSNYSKRQLLVSFSTLVSLIFMAPNNIYANTSTQENLSTKKNFKTTERSEKFGLPLGKIFNYSFPIKSRGFVNITGPEVTLTLKGVPAKEALLTIAKIGGYGLLFLPDPANNNPDSTDIYEEEITMSFKDETYERALNSILLAAGLQGKKDKNTIFVGRDVLVRNLEPLLSKVYRLNQVSAVSAADYLASLGAIINKVNIKGPIYPPLLESGISPSSSNDANILSYGAVQGPLKGLLGTTDTRLQTITLIGTKELINTAENYIKQLDLRHRQVALEVKIVDVLITDTKSMSNKSEWRSDHTYIINESGMANLYQGTSSALTNAKIGGLGATLTKFPNQQFLNWFQAQIQSGTAKILATPTMILSESNEELLGGALSSLSAGSSLSTTSIGRPYANESYVAVGTKTITDYTITPGTDGAPPTCTPVFETAGLTFGAKIHKIDDNGFVSFSISPEISAITERKSVGTCGTKELFADVLSVRRLDTGTVRVKHKNTLVLTGVLKDEDVKAIKKWPIIGDIPILGRLFRENSSKTIKSELIILVTPKIINDTDSYYYTNQLSSSISDGE